MRKRIASIDIARAISVILVVLHHIVLMLPLGEATIYADISNGFLPFRMPLFFFISGVVFAGAGDARTAAGTMARAGNLLRLFLSWSAIDYAFFVTDDLLAGTISISDEISSLLLRPRFAWFLLALAIFYPIAGLTPRRCYPLLLVATIITTLLTYTGYWSSLALWERLLAYLPWFVGGATLSPLVMRNAGKRRLATAFLIIPWFWISFHVMNRPSAPPAILFMALGASGILVGLLLAMGLAHTRLAAPLTIIGRNTLPIYVAHQIVLVALEKVIGFAPSAAPAYLLMFAVSGVIAPVAAATVSRKLGVTRLWG